MKEKPESMLINIKPNIGWLSRSLTTLFFGLEVYALKFNYFIIFFILALIISFFGLIGLFCNKTQKSFLLSYTLIGALGYIFALLLTGGGYRYAVSLMPICFLLIDFSSLGISSAKKINKKFKSIKSKHIFALILITILLSDLVFYKKNKFNLQFINLQNQDELNYIDNDYFISYKEVFKNLNKKQKILSSEDSWIIGFANVNPNNVKGIYALPPFIPNNYSITKLLDEFDVLTVSNVLKKETPSVATQSYLRYKLHLKKYFEKNSDKWNEIIIQNYGSIFFKNSLN